MCAQWIGPETVKLVKKFGKFYPRSADHYADRAPSQSVLCDACGVRVESNTWGWQDYDVCQRCVAKAEGPTICPPPPVCTGFEPLVSPEPAICTGFEPPTSPGPSICIGLDPRLHDKTVQPAICPRR